MGQERYQCWLSEMGEELMVMQRISGRGWRWWLAACVIVGVMAGGVSRGAAQDPTGTPPPDETPGAAPDGPPFSFPLKDPAGPATWLYEQHFGNTIAAYNFGNIWYASGQQLHFGADFEAPCGTPVHAIADGVVTNIDAEGFGAGPHSVVIRHTGTGYTSLYGHLFERAPVEQWQEVSRGELIGHTGDPDGTCGSRPHLHLEIRSDNYSVSYNPLTFFELNWHMLASIGPIDQPFEQDLDRPYRWMTLEDQPDVEFGGSPLNNYRNPWPPRLEVRAPEDPPAARQLDPLGENASVTIAPVSLDAWNLNFWWDAADPDAVYVVDQVQGEGSGIFRQALDGSERTYQGAIPPAVPSPNGDVTVQHEGGGTFEIYRRTDGGQWVWPVGNYPSVSPDGTRLLWTVYYGQVLPGTQPPGIEVWISNLDGALQRLVYRQSGGWVRWLDGHRLLIGKPVTYTAETQLYILDVDSQDLSPQFLGSFNFLRGVRVAPGGGRIAFYLAFQEIPADSGVYVLETQPGAQPRKLDFFGSFRWRDDDSLYFLSFDQSQEAHTLHLIDVNENIPRQLTDLDTQPIYVANGEWKVGPGGMRIAFIDPRDYGLYLITLADG